MRLLISHLNKKGLWVPLSKLHEAELGKMWRYSIVIDVLGAVIEKVIGMSLHGAVRKLVTHPLSKMDTDFKAVDMDRLITAYADNAGEQRRLQDFDTCCSVHFLYFCYLIG